jgi:glycerophosphoryl diester phosphodiesterase
MRTPKFLYRLAFLLIVFSSCEKNTPQAIHRLNITNARELQEFFRYSGDNRPIISGHRGGMMKGYPENSIGVFENTLRYTPAIYEVDPRLTKDSVVVLLHDETLERTTTGTGKVSDYTYEALKQLKLKDIENNITAHRIPTLVEALEWSRGKTVLNLDKKDVPLAIIAKILRQCGNEAVLVSVSNPKEARFYYDDNPERMMTAYINSKAVFEAYEKAGIPWKNIVAYIGPLNKSENRTLYQLLHDEGVMCMISAASSYDRLREPGRRAANYRDAFSKGADILETDYPIAVAEAIRSLVPKTSIQQKYISISQD